MHTYLKTWVPVLVFISLLQCPAAAEEILTWDDCLAEAHKNNPEIISAVEVVNQEEATKTITASSLYPQITASAGASTTETKATSEAGVKTKTTTDSYSYGVSGSQLLFDGFKTTTDVKAAAENVKAKQENYRYTSSSVRLSLRTAFINLLKSQELVHVADEIVKIRRSNLELITLRYHSGLEHKGALLTAEANIAEANAGFSQAKRDVDLSQRQLSKEMGRDEFAPLSVTGDFNVTETVDVKPDFEGILKKNPSLLEAAARTNAASFDMKSARADFYPQVSASTSAEKTDAQWPPKDERLSAGVSVSLPLFEGGLRHAQVSKADAAYRQAAADQRSTRDSVLVNLEEAWTALQDAIETVEVQRKSLEAAVERSKIAEAEYSTGFISFDNWTIIEDNLVTAKRSFLNAQANVLLAEANWIQAKGEPLEYAQKEN